MEIAQHFRVVWQRRWRVLAASLAVAALAFGWSSTRPPVYRATTVVSVTSGRATAGQAVIKDDTLFIAHTYAALAETRPVVADAALRSGLPVSASTAGRRLSATASAEVGFLTVSATGPSPQAATALAQAGGDALVDAVAAQQDRIVREALAPVQAEIAQLEQRLAQPDPAATRPALQSRYDALVRSATERRLQQTDRVVVVAPARARPTPVSPVPWRDALLALLAALVVNSELAVLLAALDDRFSADDDDEHVSEVTGLPVLARVPSTGDVAVLEAFRTLRTNLMFMETLGRLRTVAVVSVDPGAGKSHTCIQLSHAAADLEVPVVLVDADLRRPSVHRYLDVPLSPGLGELLAGAEASTVLRPAPGNPRLHVLTAGAPVPDAAGVVASQQFAQVLEQLDDAAMVVVDTPAVAIFADALAIASHCHATLLVVDAGSSRRRRARQIVKQLRQVGANPIGVVLNRTDAADRSSYHYYARAGRDPVRR